MAADLPTYADVILPLPLPNTFTYSIDESLRTSILPGMRIIVQFGTRKFYTAIIKTLHNNKPKDYSTKDIVWSVIVCLLIIAAYLYFNG